MTLHLDLERNRMPTGPAQPAPQPAPRSPAVPHQTADAPARADPDLRAAVEFALASKAPATVRAYQADWRHFVAWCASRSHTPLPAHPTVIAAYLAAHARGVGGVERLKTSTLQRRMAAIGAYHTANYHPNPCQSPEVRATWHGIRRQLGWSQNRAAPAITSVLRQLADTCDTERYIGLRDRAMILLGFAALLRRSEVVALDVSDIVLVAEGLEVHVAGPVNEAARNPERRVDVRAVPYGDNPGTCPVRAWLAWRDATGLTEGAAFRPVHPRARVGHYDAATIQRAPRLTDLAVYRAVQTAVRRAGLETPLKYRGHSLRAGAAVQAGPVATDQELMEAGGWASLEVVRSYTSSSRIWENPVAGRLGL
jgi:integrase